MLCGSEEPISSDSQCELAANQEAFQRLITHLLLALAQLSALYNTHGHSLCLQVHMLCFLLNLHFLWPLSHP